ncbi:hypothetical protein AAG570_003322 [Ranatra chinensis]|uniref:Uncharacterized protein n=1 Tax=Ranatra chinensis TaxID=642074 RepID=A0ABD0YPA8_9HEMI
MAYKRRNMFYENEKQETTEIVAKKLGDRCSEDAQCTQGLERTSGKTACINFQCSCPVQHAPVKGWCIGQSGHLDDLNCTQYGLADVFQNFPNRGRGGKAASSSFHLYRHDLGDLELFALCGHPSLGDPLTGIMCSGSVVRTRLLRELGGFSGGQSIPMEHNGVLSHDSLFKSNGIDWMTL